MGAIATSMFAGVTALADLEGAHHCERLRLGGLRLRAPTQRTVIAQVASAVLGGPHSVGFFYMQAATALILVLAANTAFNGFRCSARSWPGQEPCPQLYTGRSLAYSNGIVFSRRRRAADLHLQG